MKKFLSALNPAYKGPPTRKTIAGPLLDAAYSEIKGKVDAILNDLDWLNIVTDESNDINHSRICNISIHTPYGSLHYISEDIGAKRMDAAGYANWLRTHLQKLTDNDFARINSIATDTCNTMLSMRKELLQSPDFKHVLFIPCDSHGIQLLVKDLLSIPRLQTILNKAQAIVKAFRKAPLQYARLREIQLEIYNEHRSLILSVITRWGTQFRLVNSVIKSKEALRRYVEKYEPKDLKFEAFEYIFDRDFWRDIDTIRELLQPIDEILRMSESSKSHLGHVFSRWMDILKHLKRKISDIPELDEFTSASGTFATRYKRQVSPIHILAFYLVPNHHHTPLSAEHENIIYEFIKQYTTSDEELRTFLVEFQAFRSQRTPFGRERICWKLTEDATLFWSNMYEHTKVIGKFAIRIFSTPTNSVSSEQAFSTQNLIHNKLRNGLASPRVDKLTYAYRNGRVLRRLEVDSEEKKFVEDVVSPYSLTTAEEVELENILLVAEGVENDDICENELRMEVEEFEGVDVDVDG
jgi:hypothetical protein